MQIRDTVLFSHTRNVIEACDVKRVYIECQKTKGVVSTRHNFLSVCLHEKNGPTLFGMTL